MNNAEAIAKALTTPDFSTGLLNDEQARSFVRQVFSTTPTLQQARTIPMRSKKMNVDRLGVGQRLLRKRSEGAAFSTSTKPTTTQVQLSAVDLQLPWEVTEEVFRYNLEGDGLEDTLIQMMTRQVGVDLSDLAWNGDTTIPSSTTTGASMSTSSPADGGAITVASTSGFPNAGTLLIDSERIQYDGKTSTTFTNIARGADGTTLAGHTNGTTVALATDGLLTATDGWIKKANVSGRAVDGSAINSGALAKEHFKAALDAMPSRYLSSPMSSEFRWIMHPRKRVSWLDYLAARNTGAGDAALIGPSGGGAPYGFPILEDGTLPTSTIIFTVPRNLLLGMSLDIAVRRDASSKDVLSRSVRYYQIDLAADAQIEQADAVVKITGLA